MTKEPPWGRVYRMDARKLYDAGASKRAWLVYVQISSRRRIGVDRPRARMDTLAEELGVSKRTVQRGIKELKDLGLLQVSRTGRSSIFSFPSAVENPVKLRLVSGGAE